ncbi:YecA family protein [Paenibacillus abyssi]|uniref:YecA family protein n=1 Tax=Paenibacillus abyssi TaxID=1340531 RepID=UPI003623257D
MPLSSDRGSTLSLSLPAAGLGARYCDKLVPNNKGDRNHMATEFSHLYKLMHAEYAIRGEVKQNLSEILSLLSKIRLSDIARSVNLSGRSKMNKQELAKALQEYILDSMFVEELLRLAREDEFSLYQVLIRESYVKDDNLVPGVCLFFMDNGLLHVFMDKDDKLYFVIPEEFRELNEQLDWLSLNRMRERHQLVLQYIQAVVHLYGVCKPELLIEIFNNQNHEKLHMSELLHIANFHLRRSQTYCWMDGYLANSYFDSAPDEFETLLRKIENKPRYVPNNEELLRYEDDFYFEMTPQLMQLRLFILNQLNDNSVLADNLIHDIQLLCSMEEPLQVVFNELERRGIEFQTFDQAKKIAHLVTEVYNHTRLWSNCGHTPAELSATRGNRVNPVILGQRVVPLKIGRNDPCPCGSGLKYKKCCDK